MSLFPFATTEDLTLADQEVTASSIREYEIDFEKEQEIALDYDIIAEPEEKLV